MRDANLIFHDGTNFTSTVTPTSLTRTGGSAVLDVGKSGVRGLWVSISLAVAIVGSGGTILCNLQYAPDVAFGTAANIRWGFQFPSLNNIAFPALVPWRMSVLAQSNLRYWRILMTTGGTVTTETLYSCIDSGPERDDVA
jgi:hypothetical protein